MKARAKSIRQGGYVLVMVLAALALIALGASRFALRIDGLRSQALSWRSYAQAQVEAASAQQAAIYWMTTRPPGRAGFGLSPEQELRADGRLYSLASGAQIRVQDTRGLMPLNVPMRGVLTQLLLQQSVNGGRADALIDVLLDYQDTDRLKRLLGAEADEYRALGLPEPRNDYLLVGNELQRMPLWREDPELVQALLKVSSTEREVLINPNTAPKEFLRALAPSARPDQLELLLTLRKAIPFNSEAGLQAATGVSMPPDSLMFHVGERMRLTVWAPGLPHALQYNLKLDLDGRDAPWQIMDLQSLPRDKNIDAETDRPTPFPLAITPGRP